jgi:hypothetical protein
LVIVLALEAGLLVVAANTGFLGGPVVMANMAADRWMPRQFRQLSSRLVTQNGVLLMGGAALLTLAGTRGAVSLLVVLYSINVFLTFSLSLFGLCRHWLEQRLYTIHWRRSFALSALGFTVTFCILIVTLIEKFMEGGWLTLMITGALIGLSLLIRRHYDGTQKQLNLIDDLYSIKLTWDDRAPSLPMDKNDRTAIFLVGNNRGAAMNMLQWVLKQFPDQFRNFVFVSVGEVDKQNFDGQRTILSLQTRIENSLNYFTTYCTSRGLPSSYYQAYGADPQEELTQLLAQVTKEFPSNVSFANKLVFERESPFTRFLHNQMPLAMQRKLHLAGHEMIIVPIQLPDNIDTPPPGPRYPIK